MPAQHLELQLEKLTYGGDALAHLPDGRAAFVPFAIPGEKVQVRILEEKQGHVRTQLVEVLNAAPQRILPKCIHFKQCGGCHYQHMPYEAQLAAKMDILRDQLRRIGKIENPNIMPIVPSPNPWHYRNHIQFHLTRGGKLGFQASHSHEIIPISECHLPEKAINDLWPHLAFEPECGVECVSLRLGRDEEMMIILESSSPELPELEVEADVSVLHLLDEDAFVMAGNEHLVMEVLGRPFRVSAGSFFQVNTAMAEKMVGHILSELQILPSTTVMDIYCGVGLFSAFLAPHAGRVIGIESSISACQDFAANLDEFDNVELYEAPAENVLPYLDVAPDIILVDPPRAGLDKRLLDSILNRKPMTLLYVSCDPSTLARDMRRLLDGGYRLEQVTPFDLFPQTYHIETINRLTR